MDDKTQKERLEQELRFLKESFEAEVITKEEFEKGKDRIEKKLKEIQNLQKYQNSEIKEEKSEEAAKAEEQEKDNPDTDKKEDKIRLNVIQADEPLREPIAEKPAFTVEKKNKSKFLRFSIVFVVLLLVALVSYSLLKNNKANSQKSSEMFKKVINEASKANVMVLNGRNNCFNCDAERVLAILEGLFGELNIKEIDYGTDEGRKIADKFEISMLPAFILDSNISTKPNFEELKRIFVKKDDIYLLSKEAAGSTFYFRRENMPNKLDLFVIEGDDASIKAEKNLQGFLQVFKDLKFEKHYADEKLAKELAIKNFPSFLINNQVKFSGVHSAETIKENFCEMNKAEECEQNLPSNLA